MFSVNIWALIAAILPILVTGSISDFNEFGGKDWIWILLIAVFTGAMGHVLMSWAHAYVEAARSSLYLLGMHVVAVGAVADSRDPHRVADVGWSCGVGCSCDGNSDAVRVWVVVSARDRVWNRLLAALRS